MLWIQFDNRIAMMGADHRASYFFDAGHINRVRVVFNEVWPHLEDFGQLDCCIAYTRIFVPQ